MGGWNGARGPARDFSFPPVGDPRGASRGTLQAASPRASWGRDAPLDIRPGHGEHVAHDLSRERLTSAAQKALREEIAHSG